MLKTLEQDIKNKKVNLLETDLKKYLVDKNKITEYPKRFWFKGSRFR